MQLGKSFTYAFEDAQWISKLLIGALISIIPLVNIAWGGYTTEIIRRVSRDDAEPLAGWDNFGKYFIDGLILVIAGMIYALPIIILIIPLFPVFISAAQARGDTQSALTALGVGLAVILACLIVLYLLFLSLLYPAVQINFARYGTFGSCFQIGKIIKLVSGNLGNFVVAWLAYLAVSILAGMVGGTVASILAIIPCLGWLLSLVISALIAPYIGVVYSHLFGQVAAQAMA